MAVLRNLGVKRATVLLAENSWFEGVGECQRLVWPTP